MQRCQPDNSSSYVSWLVRVPPCLPSAWEAVMGPHVHAAAQQSAQRALAVQQLFSAPHLLGHLDLDLGIVSICV